MKGNWKVPILTTLVVIHSIIGISSILFILLYAFSINVPIITTAVICIVLSFIIFRRCIHIDIYEYVRDGEDDIPDYAQDNYIRKLIQKILLKEPERCKNLTDLRLDIIGNVEPLLLCDTKHDMIDICNYRIHYIVINVILIILLMLKYKLKQFLPLFLLWFFVVFKV